MNASEQCHEREDGGVRCELDVKHSGGHWISPETIWLHMNHRVTLLNPRDFAVPPGVLAL